MAGAAVGLVFLLLLLVGAPIAIALLGAGVMGVWVGFGSFDLLVVVPQQIFRSLDSFPFLTIPLFVFVGVLMAEGGIARRLIDCANILIGRQPGGLGATIVASAMFFHGISGSSTADTAAIGRATLPELTRQGYPISFSTALLAASGATATLIPPTIDLILIGVIANISIAGLFAAGIIPALINGFGLMSLVIFIAWKNGYGIKQSKLPWSLKVVTVFKATPAIFMIVIILGGILTGAFTPTEAAAVAVAYGLILVLVVYRDLSISQFPRIFVNTIEISGVVFFVIAMGAVIAYAMTILRVPTALAIAIEGISPNKYVFLLLVQTLFFVIGMFMDTVPALLILMPILTPIAISYGVEPIHFGILVESNIALGMATPPVGVCLFAACAVTRLPIEKTIRPLLPMIAILTTTMLIITYVEGFSMFLPRLMGLTD